MILQITNSKEDHDSFITDKIKYIPMKKINYYTFLTALFISLSAFTYITSSDWKVRENEYEVKFSGSKVSGNFKGLKANIQFDEMHPETSKISATIDATSVSTGFFLKTSHVKAEDALGVDKYPLIQFVSESVARKGDLYQAIGKLTIKGITKEAKIDFTCIGARGERTFNGRFTVTPKEFNITRTGTPEQVTISLKIPVTR
jgi:polyisoprenoid-binding protein YceI